MLYDTDRARGQTLGRHISFDHEGCQRAERISEPCLQRLRCSCRPSPRLWIDPVHIRQHHSTQPHQLRCILNFGATDLNHGWDSTDEMMSDATDYQRPVPRSRGKSS